MRFRLNGIEVTTDVCPTKNLVDFLREDMNLTGVKKGCEIGECGACTIIIDKKAVNSCMMMVGQVEGHEVLTIEGVSSEVLTQLQEKLLAGGAVQCGYCTPGMVMSILALLYKNPNPSEKEVARAIDGNLCRCTGYKQIIESVKGMHLEEIKL